jgi:zinc/manganese transport system permease protein
VTASAGARGLAGPSWDLVVDVQRMLSLHFMVNALRAGTAVAVAAAVVGWHMVLRRQSFIGHTLAVVSFPGAAVAIWAGISATVGFFAGSVLGAVVLASAPRAPVGRVRSQETALIGTVQATALALGALAVSLYGGFLDSLTGLLFGSFLGVSDGQVVVLVTVAAVVVAAMAVLGRPLLFSGVDEAVAAARGVPARAVGTAFLLLLGVTAAEASQVTGVLLVFALLVMPAAAAQQVTCRPGPGTALAAAIGVGTVWLGLGAAFYSTLPVGFTITTAGFAAYVAAAGGRAAITRWGRPGRRGRGVRPVLATHRVAAG